MKIKYLLCPEVLACQRKDSLATAARRMHTGRVSALAVCIGADPVGVISESAWHAPSRSSQIRRAREWMRT